MSILLVLLTFLLIVVSGYLRRQKAQCAVARVEVRTSPGQTREDTFAIPPGYCFHPSHTRLKRLEKRLGSWNSGA